MRKTLVNYSGLWYTRSMTVGPNRRAMGDDTVSQKKS